MKPWSERALELHRELAEVTQIGRFDPRWWLVAAGAAVVEPWPARGAYLISDAEPGADTFMGYEHASGDPIRDAIVAAHAARIAIRQLDGTLPEQPLSVAIERSGDGGALAKPVALQRVAFAIGDRVVIARLRDTVAEEQPLADLLARELDEAGLLPHEREDPEPDGPVPFATISMGIDPIDRARHAHRRAWGSHGGPWLGLGRTANLATVSTCHMAVDGYGHARIVAAIAEAQRALAPQAPTAPFRKPPRPPREVPGVPEPLGIAWRALDKAPRATSLGYALGKILHARAGRNDAPFSPTFQIPVAPGSHDDNERRRRRVVFAVSSVRFSDDGTPEPFEAFATRTREILAREAAGEGLCARMLAAARAMPAPLAWKRKQFSTSRPRWLDRISDVLGGRACLSRLTIDAPGVPLCAVSSPSRFATRGDPLGACVVTAIDHANGAASITACGSGLAGTAADAEVFLDELLTHMRSNSTP